MSRISPPNSDQNWTQKVEGDYNQVIGQMTGGEVNQYHIHQPLPLSIHQLPGDIHLFTGREDEIKHLLDLLQPDKDTTAVKIATISGMAGVGKTTFAIHIAHLVKDNFPDTQLYINLQGMGDSPLDPCDVLGQWLGNFGLDEAKIPKDLSGRVAIYRSWLADKHALIVLDNARDEAQVSPLLPGSSSCSVLITSRHKLGTLSEAEGIDLSIMSEAEALKLLERLVGTKRFQKDLNSAKHIVNCCGRLPLPIDIAGGILRNKTHWELDTYANKLSDEKKRLTNLKASDKDVYASLSLSYQELSSSDAKLFRYLGLLLPDLNTSIVAFISETTEEIAADALERLVDSRLVECFNEERYRLHDLIRIYANQKLEELESPVSRIKLLHRLGGFYFQQEQRRNAVHFYNKSLILAKETLNSQWQAESLLGLCNSYSDVYGNKGQLVVALLFGKESLQSFESLENQNGIARAKMCIGTIYSYQKELSEAEIFLVDSLEIFQATENTLGERGVLNNLGGVNLRCGNIEKAIEFFESSLRISYELKDFLTVGLGLGNLASTFKELGRIDLTLDYGQRSLQAFRDAEDPLGEGDLLDFLGKAYEEKGDLEKASHCYLESLRVCRSIEKHDWIDWEPELLLKLGNICKFKENLSQAVDYYQEGLDYCRKLCGQNLCGFAQSSEESTDTLPTRTESVRATGVEIADELAFVYMQQECFQKAIELCECILEPKQILGDYVGEIKTLNILGDAFRNQCQWKRSFAFYQQGLNISRKKEIVSWEAKTLANLGLLYAQQNKLEQAVDLWQEALGKMSADSTAANKVTQWLESPESLVQKTQFFIQQGLVRYSIYIGAIAFISLSCVREHSLIALITVSLLIGFITLKTWCAHYN